jgi:hypothetical protein
MQKHASSTLMSDDDKILNVRGFHLNPNVWGFTFGAHQTLLINKKKFFFHNLHFNQETF